VLGDLDARHHVHSECHLLADRELSHLARGIPLVSNKRKYPSVLSTVRFVPIGDIAPYTPKGN